MNPRTQTVIITTEREGDGTEDNPSRAPKRIYTTGGDFIAEDDAWLENETDDVLEDLHHELCADLEASPSLVKRLERLIEIRGRRPS